MNLRRTVVRKEKVLRFADMRAWEAVGMKNEVGKRYSYRSMGLKSHLEVQEERTLLRYGSGKPHCCLLSLEVEKP